jgi:alkylhydroperoxidase/carboxymuconolactone decarboxylase family protein YurZ
MTRKQAQALEVLRLAFDAARKTGLTDEEIFEAINLSIYLRGVSDRVKPNK